MKKDSKAQSFQIPILIIDILLFALLGLTIGLVDFCMLKRVAFPNISNGNMLGLGITMFIFTLVGFIFTLFVEYKFNRLKLKNIFLYLGVAIALINFIAVITLPSEGILPNGVEYAINATMRTYYIIVGFFYALLPYLCFYLIPRKVITHRYLDIFLYIVLGFALLSIVLSFITDWDNYLHFFENLNGIGSIFNQKNSFGLILVTGMFACIVLRIRHKNYKWILFLIPLYIFLVFSLSNLSLTIGTLLIIIYVIVQLVLLCKKSKDNLIIILLLVGFFLLISPLFIINIVRSESGFLFLLKDFFLKLQEHVQSSFSSRGLIWESSFKLLSSWRVIIGYGVDCYGNLLHQVYESVRPTWDYMIYSSHNSVIELLGNGGIILLGIYTFLYIRLIYVAFKVRNKENHWTIDITLLFFIFFIFHGVFENSYLCGLYMDFVPSIVIITLIMSEYYILKDKDEKVFRKDIVFNINAIKKNNPKSKLMKLNKKRLIYEAKYIAYDLNSKIKL